MSTTLFKEISYTLKHLVDEIDMGDIGLPELQRPFVWPNTKVRDLFDSMYRGFPIGYLLFWANATDNGHRRIGADSKQRPARLLVVDGQQRLTSLYAVLKGIPVLRENYNTERIYIAFRPKDKTFAVTDAAVRRDPEFILDISELWQKPRHRFVQEFLNRLRESRPLTDAEESHIYEAIDCLYDLHNYPFTALELSPAVDEESVAEVFVRINSKGTPLNQADFILTLMSVFWDEGRAQLEKFCRAARKPPTVSGPSPFNYIIQPDPDQLLRTSVALAFRRARLHHVYSILRGKDLETEQFSDERREQQFAILKEAQEQVLNIQNWHEFLKAVKFAGFVRANMITSQVGLLYAYALFLIGKRDFNVDAHRLRELIARWLFMTALTGRYTSSPESLMEQDLARLRDLRGPDDFQARLDRVITDTLTEDYWNINLPNELASTAARSPSLFAFYAALNLLEAKVLFSKMRVAELLTPDQRAYRAAIERHHLFPKGHLARIGIIDQRDVNQIANYALVEWSDNSDISDDPPSEYMPRYAVGFSAHELERMRYWHALPDGWESMAYLEFLISRRQRIAGVIRDAFTRLTD